MQVVRANTRDSETRPAGTTPLVVANPAELSSGRGHTALPPLLSVQDLTVRFGSLTALDGVNIEVQEGQLVALAGENGAGKTTLAGCICGDLSPTSGRVLLGGRPLPPRPRGAYRRGVAVVRQRTELCDKLDVAANLFLGQEGSRFFLDHTALHAAAAELLARLNIPIGNTNVPVGYLSGGLRQLLSIARAIVDEPRLLVLDEPTFALGVKEGHQVEDLVLSLREKQTTTLLVSHDVDQMFRLADRVVVLRHGRVVANLDPRTSHREDLVALLSGQRVESSARRQLMRLQGLVDQLASSDPSSTLPVILSSLGAALSTKCLCIHLRTGAALRCAASLGLPPDLPQAWLEVSQDRGGGPVAEVLRTEQLVVDEDVKRSSRWSPFRRVADVAKAESSWSVPVMGSSGLIGVITVLRPTKGAPQKDELDLVKLYAGYAANAIEREKLLGDATARNQVLETIRDVLQTLAGPTSLPEALSVALGSLRRGLAAEEVVLVSQDANGDDERSVCAPAPRSGPQPARSGPALDWARVLQGSPSSEAKVVEAPLPGQRSAVGVVFPAGGGTVALVATWNAEPVPEGARALIEDAAHSVQLALEREEVAAARQEAAALRRSQEMQQGFLSRLSHELRTPLTAIRGYASSLLQPDVNWDGASQQRFLTSVAGESARLGRLVEDLLDFSAMESGIFRLHNDWCDIGVVIDAAVGCLPPSNRLVIEVACDPELPPVWADHDRMEQVLLNLLDNALRHNPPGTHVRVEAAIDGASACISVADDGPGVPADVADSFFEPGRRRRTPTAGAGLGLSIAHGIVEAHGGAMELGRAPEKGTVLTVRIPVEGPARSSAEVLEVGSGG